MERELMLLSGSAHPQLAQKISDELGIPLMSAEIGSFSEGETRVVINDKIRGEDVFVIQPSSPPVNQNLMELMIMIDALRRASAGRITAIMPYFGYSRQDRKDRPRVPISAKLVANLLTAAGVDRVLTLDLHSHQIQGFFDIPLDHLYAKQIFIDALKERVEKPIIVSPDVGAVKMAQGFATQLNCDMAVIDKRRIDDTNTKVNHIIGSVEGFDAVIADDIVATAGSIAEAAKTLKERGARSIIGAITHGVLSGPAIERIRDSDIDMLYISDSIPLPEEKKLPNITQLSTASILARAIQNIHDERSLAEINKDV